MEGPWTCRECGRANDRFVFDCRKCGQPRTDSRLVSRDALVSSFGGGEDERPDLSGSPPVAVESLQRLPEEPLPGVYVLLLVVALIGTAAALFKNRRRLMSMIGELGRPGVVRA